MLKISRASPKGPINTPVRIDPNVGWGGERYRLRAVIEYTSVGGGHFVMHR